MSHYEPYKKEQLHEKVVRFMFKLEKNINVMVERINYDASGFLYVIRFFYKEEYLEDWSTMKHEGKKVLPVLDKQVAEDIMKTFEVMTFDLSEEDIISKGVIDNKEEDYKTAVLTYNSVITVMSISSIKDKGEEEQLKKLKNLQIEDITDEEENDE